MDIEKQTIHVTPEMVNNHIVKKEFLKAGTRTDICVITLSNGMEIVGSTNRQETTPNDDNVGKQWAEADAFDKAYGYVICLINAKGE